MYKPSGLVRELGFDPTGVCCKHMKFSVSYPEKIVFDIHFTGGCRGNLAALATLLDGMKAEDIYEKLIGNPCGSKETSCMDQFAQFIKEYVIDEAEDDD